MLKSCKNPHLDFYALIVSLTINITAKLPITLEITRAKIPQSFAMTQITVTSPPGPQDDLHSVVQTRTREWHFHIYFLLQSPTETAAALALRDAVLRLRRDGM